MKTIIAALIARLSFAKSDDFETAIASFNKVVDNLQAVATKRLQVAAAALKEKEAAAEKLAAAQAAAAQATAEAEAKEKLALADVDRAEKAANKIKALIGSV